ncbi:hypothetical protein [Kineosporia sp. NBRC 101677]|uniref:PIN-like domain-containing protein n=1 Tax=Kineosporia sp. NBRC 101677 TaxID=3032197 RepID=UPI0025534C12|nr:hypothetical protein [Kineosporia sp. NBRC 101677]
MSRRAPRLPHVFVDRSLGRILVPQLLREAGVQLTTLAEYYGIPQDEGVEDVTWIAEAAQQGWILFMEDDRIRRRPAERAMIHQHQARCFCLANANLRSSEMAQCYLRNLPAIARAGAQPGPFLYSVQAGRIEKLAIN